MRLTNSAEVSPLALATSGISYCVFRIGLLVALCHLASGAAQYMHAAKRAVLVHVEQQAHCLPVTVMLQG